MRRHRPRNPDFTQNRGGTEKHEGQGIKTRNHRINHTSTKYKNHKELKTLGQETQDPDSLCQTIEIKAHFLSASNQTMNLFHYS